MHISFRSPLMGLGDRRGETTFIHRNVVSGIRRLGFRGCWQSKADLKANSFIDSVSMLSAFLRTRSNMP